MIEVARRPPLAGDSYPAASRFVARFRSSPTLGGRYARNAAWSVAAAVASQAFSVVAAMVVARTLGSVRFGEFGMIQGTLGVFGILAVLGLGSTATKYVAEFRTTDSGRVGRILALSSAVALAAGCAVAAVVFVVAPVLAARAISAPHLEGPLRWGSLLLLCTALNGAQTGALSGLEAFDAIARVNVVRGIATLPCVVVGVLGWQVRGAVAGLVAASAVACFAGALAIRRRSRSLGIRIDYRGAPREWRILRDFSLPALFGSLLVAPATWAANTMLVRHPGGYAELGLFSAANQWRTAIGFLPSTLLQPLLSTLSNLRGAGNHDAWSRLFRASLGLALALAVVPALLVSLLAPWILSGYGPGFASAATLVYLLAGASVVSCTADVVGQAIASAGRMWWGLLLNCIWAAALLTAASRLIPLHGARGLAEAVLFSYAVHALTVSLFARLKIRGAPACR
jgi:O-antigen/teichoic acid export membrane protein